MKRGTSMVPKIFKFCKVEDKFKRNNFPFGKVVRIPNGFWNIDPGNKPNLNLKSTWIRVLL
jgi:hypothetical protein